MGRKGKRARGWTGPGASLGCLLLLALIAIAGYAGWGWLKANPQHNPWAPLDLRDPIGWATTSKLVDLKGDAERCRAVLNRSDVSYTILAPRGETACLQSDRTRLEGFPLSPTTPATTCPVAVALEMWRRQSVEPAARSILGSEFARFEHLGVYNCRQIRGSRSGNWSEHATGNAIDISAIMLADGRKISLLDDWDGESDKARFLRRIRDDACGVFATVLSPDFNAAHADHFHLDQASRWASVCR